MENLSDIFAEEEARRLVEAKAEIAAEKAAWNALTPEQQQAEIDKAEQKWASLADDCDEFEDDEDIDDDDEGDD